MFWDVGVYFPHSRPDSSNRSDRKGFWWRPNSKLSSSGSRSLVLLYDNSAYARYWKPTLATSDQKVWKTTHIYYIFYRLPDYSRLVRFEYQLCQ